MLWFLQLRRTKSEIVSTLCLDKLLSISIYRKELITYFNSIQIKTLNNCKLLCRVLDITESKMKTYSIQN